MTSGFVIEEVEHTCKRIGCGITFKARSRPGVVKYCPECRKVRKLEQSAKNSARARKARAEGAPRR